MCFDLVIRESLILCVMPRHSCFAVWCIVFVCTMHLPRCLSWTRIHISNLASFSWFIQAFCHCCPMTDCCYADALMRWRHLFMFSHWPVHCAPLIDCLSIAYVLFAAISFALYLITFGIVVLVSCHPQTYPAVSCCVWITSTEQASLLRRPVSFSVRDLVIIG